jgi:hypothetical protein
MGYKAEEREAEITWGRGEREMKTRIIKNQEEFDKIKRVEADEEIIFEASKIEINCRLEVFGILRLKGWIKSSWNNQYIVAWGNSTPYIEAWGNSTPHIVAWGNSTLHIVAWENSVIHGIDLSVDTSLNLFGFSIGIIPFNLKIKIKKSKQAIIQRVKPQGWFELNGITKKERVILYKRVSKDFKTQENTPNETLWIIGSTVEHPNWNPQDSECGEGKFHACSRPYFCNEFRDGRIDKYIAIQINRKDVFEWKNNPNYPHKIGFRKGLVLFECDQYGNKMEAKP